MKRRWVLKDNLDGTYRGVSPYTWVSELNRAKVFHSRAAIRPQYTKFNKRQPVYIEVQLVEIPCKE
jgi:hypothetical protein